MTLKQKTNREVESESQRGRKRYQERLIEEREAEREIKQYNNNEHDPSLDDFRQGIYQDRSNPGKPT
jgi:hypothetical protein